MNELIKKISLLGIVPVIKLNDVEKAVPLAKSLCEGGLPIAEITFRTDAAEESIRRMAREYPDMLIGAGTVLTTEQVDLAIAAGAKFIVSPGFNPKVVDYCIKKGILIIPGTSCPSDMEAALERGLEVVKFFPAEQAGGVNYLKAISAPYSKLMFMPTGGINEKNLNSYLSLPNVVACGGSWMAKEDLIEADDFLAITALVKEAIRNLLSYEVFHVGINCDNEKEAVDTAKQFAHLFGFPYLENPGSIFLGTGIEVLKSRRVGANGHLAIRTNSVERAIAYSKARGIEFDEESKAYDANGRVRLIFFAKEIGGFGIHLLQK